MTFVEIADTDGVVVANTRDPARLGVSLSPADTGDAGRSWVADSSGTGGKAIVAHVPVFGEVGAQTGRVVGTAAVGQEYPSLGESLLSAVPNLLTYLGLAGIVGVAGSLLVARRVKRQTLGLEPVEIRGLVEHREAMLTGIKEGVLGLDLDDRVTLVNAEADRMLGLPDDCVGRTLTELGVEDRLLDVLTGSAAQQDAVVFVGERILTLNRKPVAVRGVPAGSVTTMRDLTELRALEQELGVTRQTTEALRAQAHEFANRLHTISGLLELEEYAEVLRYVKRLGSATQQLAAAVTERIESPPLAALLIAKSSVAAERGIRLHLADASRVGPLDEGLAEDLATVVGNLVDNALDAVGPLGGGEVDVCVREEGAEVTVEVRDSGPGVAPELVEEVFTSGFTTKARRGRLPRLRPGADPRALRAARRLGQRAQRRRRGLRRPPAPARGGPVSVSMIRSSSSTTTSWSRRCTRRSSPAPRGSRSPGWRTAARRRWSPSPRCIPTSSCSTSICPTCPGSRCCAGCGSWNPTSTCW